MELKWEILNHAGNEVLVAYTATQEPAVPSITPIIGIDPTIVTGVALDTSVQIPDAGALPVATVIEPTLYKTKVTINSGANTDVITLLINTAVRTHYKAHRLTGLKGMVVALTDAEIDQDTENKTEEAKVSYL